MSRFDGLPFDIQLKILSFLEPLDILRLRKTCKTLNHATTERVVWIHALRQVCDRNTIYLPTFPIYDMSLSALEYAATGPERFLLAAAKQSRFVPRSHLPIQYEYVQPLDLFLVPGGRYLVTVDSTTLAVWDLGIPGSSPTITQCMKPISSAVALPGLPRHGSTLNLRVHPTEDGRGLTICLKYRLEKTLHFTIFRIFPSDKRPFLQKIRDTKHPSIKGYSSCSLSRNTVIFLLERESTLNVWDYIEDTWACIQVPADSSGVLVSDSSILLSYRDRILIWTMPPLSTHNPSVSGLPPSNVPPAFVLKPSCDEMGHHCEEPCDWYFDSSQRLFFDFTYDFDVFQRFEVVLENENFNNAVVTSIGDFRCLDQLFVGPRSSRFCNGNLVAWWDDCREMEAQLTSLPFGAKTHMFNLIASTIQLGELSPLTRLTSDSVSRSLCPFSGRFAFADKLGGFKIYDYFSESFPMPGLPEGYS